MSLHRRILAGTFAICLASGSGVALVAAQAEPAAAGIAAPAVLETEFPTAAARPSAEPPAAPAVPATVAPIPRAPEPAREPARRTGVSEAELTCLTRVILYEAGAESRAGQLAVAQVVLNRMRSGRFPRTICGVIHQRGQFSAIRGFHPPRNARWNRARRLAEAALGGQRAPGIGNAMFFHAAHVRPFSGRTRVARLGNHIFYR